MEYSKKWDDHYTALEEELDFLGVKTLFYVAPYKGTSPRAIPGDAYKGKGVRWKKATRGTGDPVVQLPTGETFLLTARSYWCGSHHSAPQLHHPVPYMNHFDTETRRLTLKHRGEKEGTCLYPYKMGEASLLAQNLATCIARIKTHHNYKE